MDGQKNGLERLCKVYLDLNETEKEKVIRLAEGLLKSQKVMSDENLTLETKNQNTDLKLA